MARIHTMMDIGRRSMQNSQTGLQTVGHNIANAATEGYSRQRVEIQESEPVTIGGLRLGMGSRAAKVTRTVNGYLEKQLQNETTRMGQAQSREDALNRVEEVFNEAENKGLNRFVTNFFNSFRELSNNPESQATRQLVKESAKYMAEDFQRISRQLKDVQRDIDQQVISEVSEINGLTQEIASLNRQISAVEIQGMPANDERDRRDLLIKKLGEKINIKYAEGDNGIVAITAGDQALLVSGYDAQKLEVSKTSENQYKREGNVDVFYRSAKDGHPYVMTRQFNGGKLGGILEVRDVTINGMLDNLDTMAYELHKNVNMVHQVGYDRYGNTKNIFFNPLTAVRDAAEKIAISSELDSDPSKIAAALDPFSPADNRVANTLSSLQNRTLLKDGTTTFDDYFNGMLGEFAVTKRQANMVAEHQKNMVGQLTKIRESISGVSLDEETTKMIEFQKAFDASARLIRTADDMMETVINLKRL